MMWGSIADWVSAGGSVFASVSALFIALRNPKSKENIRFDCRLNKLNLEVIAFNIGDEPAILTYGGIDKFKVNGEVQHVSKINRRTNLFPNDSLRVVKLSSKITEQFKQIRVWVMSNSSGIRYEIQIKFQEADWDNLAEDVEQVKEWHVISVVKKDMKKEYKAIGK